MGHKPYPSINWYGDDTCFVVAYGVEDYAKGFSEARDLLEKAVDNIEAEYPLLKEARRQGKEAEA